MKNLALYIKRLKFISLLNPKMQYTWKIKKMIKKDFDHSKNVVSKIYWEKIGTDENGNSASYRNTTIFDLDLVDFNEIIDYDNLTEEMVIDWIQSSLNDTQMNRINKKIEQKLEKLLDSYDAVSSKEFPWEV